jgi:hypothetical protein
METVTELDPQEYGRRLMALAREYLNIKKCRRCRSPRVDGYVCSFCNADD